MQGIPFLIIEEILYFNSQTGQKKRSRGKGRGGRVSVAKINLIHNFGVKLEILYFLLVISIEAENGR